MGTINWHEYLTADFDAGTLTWKLRAREQFPCDRSWNTWNTRFAGKIAGTVCPRGYRRVMLLGKGHLAHRILYEMANGPIPEGLQIDHMDQNKGNNALSNLRLATNTENMRNTGAYSNNTSGVKGVHWDKARGKWVAEIVHHGRMIYLGLFADFAEAVSARKAAEPLYHGAFAPEHVQHNIR